MWQKLTRAWKIKDVRSNILFVLLMLVVFRLVAHIPVPGVNVENLRSFLSGNQIFGLLNIFSGGTIENFSLVMLGVAPYITSSIIFQLLGMIVPQFEELQKEGESGQQKINMYTRIATVPLALLQAFGVIQLLNQSGQGIFENLNSLTFAVMMLSVTAGTMFLMWIGELITERRVGNGVSLLIFAAIISAVPTVVQNAIVNYSSSNITTYIIYIVLALLTIVGVVTVNEAQRNVPVRYARQMRGRGAAGSTLPLRLNMAGVIPIIFAISVILFPPLIAQFFVNSAGFLGRAANWIIITFQNQLFYGVAYFLLVFGFTYFYTAVIFKPDKMAENLQRQGAFIPGIRPGKETENYLAKTMNRLLFLGASFLALIAVMPIIAQNVFGTQSLVVGGAGLLIVVSVAIETAKQVNAQITMHEYDQM